MSTDQKDDSLTTTVNSDRTTNAAYSIHVNYKVWSYWPGCPYYVSAMGTLITQTYWEMHWTPIEWQKQLHIPRHPDVILNPLTTQNHFHTSGNISDNTEHDFVVNTSAWSVVLVVILQRVSLLPSAAFPRINVIWLRSTDNQWQTPHCCDSLPNVMESQRRQLTLTCQRLNVIVRVCNSVIFTLRGLLLDFLWTACDEVRLHHIRRHHESVNEH